VRPPARDDADAFIRSLYAEYSASIRARAARMLCDPHQVEDIVQETILRAWCKSDTLSSERGSVGGWLATVARNLAVDHLPARRTRPTELIEACADEAAWSVADHTEQTVTSVLVSAALMKVTANDRAVLFHVYFADQTCTKAAAELGIPVGTVKSRLSHALRRLRFAIGEEQTWSGVVGRQRPGGDQCAGPGP
jgi:RNA polymerase sigma-70 factor (ECF subfamily)